MTKKRPTTWDRLANRAAAKFRRQWPELKKRLQKDDRPARKK